MCVGTRFCQVLIWAGEAPRPRLRKSRLTRYSQLLQSLYAPRKKQSSELTSVLPGKGRRLIYGARQTHLVQGSCPPLQLFLVLCQTSGAYHFNILCFKHALKHGGFLILQLPQLPLMSLLCSSVSMAMRCLTPAKLHLQPGAVATTAHRLATAFGKRECGYTINKRGKYKLPSK